MDHGDLDGPPSPASLRALSDKVSVDKILSGMNENERKEGVPADRNGGAKRSSTGGDDCSTLTEDDRSVSSSLWRAAEGVGSVLSQSMAILRGEAPIPEQDEEDSNADRDRPSSPVNALSLPTIQSEKFNCEAGMVDEDVDVGSKVPLVKEEIDFLKDPPSEMTYTRRIALSLMKKNWYYPQPEEEDDGAADDGMPPGEGDDVLRNMSDQRKSSVASPTRGELTVFELTHKPDLAKAWAYFEHITLPRFLLEEKDPTQERSGNCLVRLVRSFCRGDMKLDRAEPGEDEQKTRLYSPIFTPLSQMGDFGLGIGLYFSTLRAITVMTLIAGLINLYNLNYFNGSEYSNGQKSVNSILLYGSAVCTEQEWVPCPTCSKDDFKNDPKRLTEGTWNGTSVFFAKQNQCERPPFTVGMVNYGTLMFIMVGMFVMHKYQKSQEIAFDEDEQTTQDYSIVIQNPPDDATDPEEWKQFFEANFDNVHVTCCTVGVDNDLLVRSLVERRRALLLLQNALPPGTDLSVINLAKIAGNMERQRNWLQSMIAAIAPGVPEHFGKLVVLNAKIQGLAQMEYPSTNIFVTFESERGQRQVLSALSVGSFAVRKNDISSVKREHLFRGHKVLKVREADEPSTVRWEDLNAPFRARLKQLATTTFVTCCAVALVAFIVSLCRQVQVVFGAYAIAGFNALFPMFAKVLTNMESHAAEGDKQASLYFKIALFRWVNTAIVFSIVVPFTSTLTEGPEALLPGVAAIFFAEITTTNAIQLADPVGHLQRHFLAPRAKTQEAMNILMQGQVYELAERYTNMTKILFLALYYCAIYPGALFLCSFALFINFFTDRFSLMRTWKPAPKLGTRISNLSRKYFLSVAVVAMAVMGSYQWSGFPYDNLCDGEETDQYQGRVWTIKGKQELVASNYTVRYCNQDLLQLDGVTAFPALPKWQPEGDEWMTADQERLTLIYGWSSVGVLAITCLIFIKGIFLSVRDMFRGTYKPTGEDQGINFSDVPSIAAYIPEVSIDFNPFPLIAADIDGIDEELFEWEDPDKPYSYYDLTRDAEQLLKGTDCTKDPSKHVFTKIRHWPPTRKLDGA